MNDKQQSRADALTDRQRRIMDEAAKHLTAWLDTDSCDCDGYGHSCGRPNVVRTRDELLELLAAHPGQPEPRGAAQVPCPICGGEAVDHLDVLERVTIAPEPRAEVTDWNTPCTGCATPRACQYDGCRKEPRAEVTGDTVLVPKRVVELLRIINRDGIIKRASELQEVYRLVDASRAQGGES